jgi:transposase
LSKNIQRKHPDKWHNNSRAQHHDNAPAHELLTVRQFLASMNVTVIPHPSYSPDLTPCEFFLFPKMKLKLKRQNFDSTEEIQNDSQKMMKTLT